MLLECITGSKYAPGFAAWCHQGMEIMYRASGRPTLIYMNYVLPLSVLKQICTMFFSVNGPQFREKNPWLEYFVLNRDSQALPEHYQVYELSVAGPVGHHTATDRLPGRVTP